MVGAPALADAPAAAVAIRSAARAQLRGQVQSPWGSRTPTGERASPAQRQALARRYASKLEQAVQRGGTYVGHRGRVMPAGNGPLRTTLRGQPWTRPVRGGGAIMVQSRAPGRRATVSDLVARGLSRLVARSAADQAALGLPSAANRTDPNDYLLADSSSVVSYNRERRGLNWVAWKVGPEEMSGQKIRFDNFRPDSRLPRGWYRASTMDYLESGFDPGHMVGSAERRRIWTNGRTFRLDTNILPQAPNNNQGPWNAFESYYQNLARGGATVYLLAGGTFYGKARTIGNGVAVPDSTWKIAVVVPKGKTLADVGAGTRVIAINVPNHNGVRKDAAWTQYRTNVRAIERMTGLRFFTGLPDLVAARLRTKVDAEDVPHADRISKFAKAAQAQGH